MELYAGLDLHSRNTYIGILDKELHGFLKREFQIIWSTFLFKNLPLTENEDQYRSLLPQHLDPEQISSAQ